jgi:pimeloyl-ACP methyl ester carboxylesterase
MIRLLTVLAALTLCLPCAAQSKPPTTSQIKKTLAQYFELDETANDERLAICLKLQGIDLSKASIYKKWLKIISKSSAKATTLLPKKKGEYFFWENSQRGFYIIGGETSKPKGLLIGMHGGGVGSGDAHGSAGAMDSAAKELGWLAIFPEVIEKTERGWTDSGTEEWVIQLIDMAIVTYDIDPDHVYLSGHSMGGYGSWTLGAHHADRVAALAPSAGAPTPVYDYEGNLIEIQSGVVANLRNTPMVVFQSTDDPRVPPDANQAAVKEVAKFKKRFGGYDDFTYWEVTDRQHGYPKGGMLALLNKIKDFKRDVHQAHIVWQPTLDWKTQFFWLYWPKPVANVIIEAEFNKTTNTFVITSDAALTGLEILLSQQMVDFSREVIVEFNGTEVARKQPLANLGCLLQFYAASDAQRTYTDTVKLR